MDQATSNLLTRTGPGTAMGNLMRRYWVPILSSSEIAEPDCRCGCRFARDER